MLLLVHNTTWLGTILMDQPPLSLHIRLSVAQCIFHKYGGSGTIQRFDALCVLGMNILNEKIYIVLWFWFVILAVITAVNLVVRAMQLFCPTTRQRSGV